MKQHFLKSFSVVVMLLFTAASVFAASGIVWSAYEYIGDGAGGGKYSNKYKISAADGMAVVNIQRPGFAEEDGIYCTFPAGISEMSCKGAIQGAGAVLYLSSFTDQETEVIVKHGLGETKFWVWYEDGTPSSEEKETIKPVMKSAELVSVTFNTAIVKVAATDKQTEDGEEVPVTAFQVVYGEITKVFTATDGQIIINNLSAGTAYEFNIYAVDAVGNISENAIKVSATTETRTSDCEGQLGHFATPDNKRISYTIQYKNNAVVYTVSALNGKVLDFCEIQTNKGGFAATIANGVATYIQEGLTIGEELAVRFLYSTDEFEGNEMTAENISLGDPNIVYYKVGDCDASTTLLPVLENAAPVRKLIRNGQLVIIRDGVEYTVLGNTVL